MNEDQKDVERQVGLCEGDMIYSSSENLPASDAEKLLTHYFNQIFDIDEENGKHEENKEEQKKEPILCKPYLVTIKEIYHRHPNNRDEIILRLETDVMGNVIKEHWSPHGSNSDDRLDSLAFGVALHHITDTIRGKWVFAEDALDLCASDEEDPHNSEIIYPVGPNFMTKTIEIDSNAMEALVRKMESSIGRSEKKWIMAVYEVMERNLLNDTEYFIGLPTCGNPAREI